jgi:2-dehydro-3-deoxygluconokinase
LSWNGNKLYRKPAKPVAIIDRPGAGDALAASVLLGRLDGDLQRGLRQGTVLAALCLSQHGDMLVTNPEEVASLMESSAVSLVR